MEKAVTMPNKLYVIVALGRCVVLDAEYKQGLYATVLRQFGVDFEAYEAETAPSPVNIDIESDLNNPLIIRGEG